MSHSYRYNIHIMPKRERDKEDVFERYGSGFAKTCKSMGVDLDKADVFKIFNMAMEHAEAKHEDEDAVNCTETQVDCETTSDDVQQNCTIYILSLKEGKYYVGKSHSGDVQKRVKDHMEGRGAAWTRKYPVIKLLKVIRNCSEFDEDKETLRMMSEHGWEDVRGGQFCQVKLPVHLVKQIEASIRSATDKCMLCGGDGHFVSTCPLANITCSKTEAKLCTRCGRNNHWIDTCFATINLQGVFIGANDAYKHPRASSSSTSTTRSRSIESDDSEDSS